MQEEKEVLRKQMRIMRQSIKPNERADAQSDALRSLKGFFDTFSFVVSYSSFKDEFDTAQINDYLVSQGKLLLPRVETNQIEVYSVVDRTGQLEKNCYGFLEPIPEKCTKANMDSTTLVIVPGLAFDEHRHRLGYGKGNYDRFLLSIPKHWKSYGLGFQSQLVKKIPITDLDVALDGIFLF